MSVLPGFHFDPLSSDYIRNSFQDLRKVLASLYGPKGQQLLFVNHETDTLASVRSFSNNFGLLQMIRSENALNPFVRFVIGAAQNAHNLYGDGGKFMCLLVCSALQKLSLLNFRKHISMKMFDYFSAFVLKYLREEDSLISQSVDFSEVHVLTSITRTIIASKLGSNSHDLEHLTMLVLKSFVNSIPAQDCKGNPCESVRPLSLGVVHFVTQEGKDIGESVLTKGLLISCSDHRVELIRKILEAHPLHFTVLFYNVCLDVSTIFPEGSKEISHSLCLDRFVRDKLYSFGQKLVKTLKGSTILLCQKVVHPILMQYLLKNGVMVLDRLGTELAQLLKNFCGAEPISTFDVPPQTESRGRCGKIETIRIVEFSGKEFLHLQNQHSSIQTIVLCNITEDSLLETKLSCTQALKALQELARSKKAFIGGGCLEVVAAAEIRTWISKTPDEHSKLLKCSKEQLAIFCETFCSVLEEMATYPSHKSKMELFTDDTYRHLWQDESSSGTCQCGSIARDDPQIKHLTNLAVGSNSVQVTKPKRAFGNSRLVLDESNCRANAWQVAFEISSLLLNTGLYIEKQS